MPEGPEVETIRLNILKPVRGRHIESIWRSSLPLRTPTQMKDFSFLKGKEVHRLSRIGKMLFVEVDENQGLIIQFGMSGKLHLVSHGEPLEKHTHLIIQFSDMDQELRFVDPRRFGDLFPYRSQEEKESKTRKLGPDILTLEKTDLVSIIEKMQKSIRPIKVLLLDQDLLSGVGNIYASEGLHLARVSPTKRASSLKKTQLERILMSCAQVMKAAVENKGTSFRSYLDANGKKGENQNFLRVFGRDKAPCPICHEIIVKIVQAGRSTFYCPKCQA